MAVREAVVVRERVWLADVELDTETPTSTEAELVRDTVGLGVPDALVVGEDV